MQKQNVIFNCVEFVNWSRAISLQSHNQFSTDLRQCLFLLKFPDMVRLEKMEKRIEVMQITFFKTLLVTLKE